MNTYETEAPRAAFAAAAVALSAITLGILVIMPAQFDSGFEPFYVLASAPPSARTALPQKIAIVPARIDVVRVRESNVARAFGDPDQPNVVWALGDPLQPNCKPAT